MTSPLSTARRPAALRRLADAATWLTTPLLPEDYLGLINPLWSTEELRGRIESVQLETTDAATIVIRPGRTWTGHRAGQWVRIGVDLDGVRHWRTFSLSSAPDRADRTSRRNRATGTVAITVKATPQGTVSTHLVRNARPGMIVGLAPAQGEFVLPSPLPGRLLFLTAGSGITPVMAMLRGLALDGAMPDVVLVHSAPTAEDVIFGTELRGLAARFPTFRLYERHTRAEGRLQLAELSELCPDWIERPAWACGPAELLDEAVAHWDSVGAEVHVEHFRPPALVSGGQGGLVRFGKSGHEVDADGSTPLLDVGENAGVLMPSGCRMGICYSCVSRLTRGKVRDLRTGEVHGEEGHLIQTCVSAAAGPVEIEL
jgi:stearoyl-CoA 9-desaturase NADPH oxidoreductase